MPRLRKYTEDWLRELCKDSYSYAEVLYKAGRKQGGGSQNTLKRKISEFNIDVSHFSGQGWRRGLFDLTDESIDAVFCKNSDKKINKYRHKLVYLKGFYHCESCGLNEWLGKEIVLEIHHIDGDTTNNELSNLKLLCPNCHSMTDNFRKRKDSVD